jgi:S1-C subfamily serine protease
VRGVIIGSVMSGRAAAQAGLTGISPDGRIGDVIIAASDKPVIKLADLAIEFDRIGVGKAVSLTISRDGVRRDQSVNV